MSPADTAVALRSLPRRWRQLLGETADDSDVAELAGRRPDAGTWSALEHARHTAAALETAAREVRLVRTTEQPTLAAAIPEVEGDHGVAGVVDRLGAAADAAAREVEEVPASAWSRTGTRDGRAVDLLTLAREAVREGVDHLHQAETALRRARAQQD